VALLGSVSWLSRRTSRVAVESAQRKSHESLLETDCLADYNATVLEVRTLRSEIRHGFFVGIEVDGERCRGAVICHAPEGGDHRAAR
jgi:hypothetical protein